MKPRNEREWRELLQRIADAAKQEGHRAIIYVKRIKDAEKRHQELQEILADSSITVGLYHAKLKKKKRQQAHGVFADDGGPHIMVATVAFGLGIDFPDVRRVYFLGAPSTVEKFYQQLGRAGRDDQPAVVELIAADSDLVPHLSGKYGHEKD